MTDKLRKGNNAAVTILRPLNVIQEGQWMFNAACRDEDPALFYDNDHETPHARQKRTEIAKAVCLTCDVRQQCLTTAIRNQEAYGIWGGHTASERWQLAKFLSEEATA